MFIYFYTLEIYSQRYCFTISVQKKDQYRVIYRFPQQLEKINKQTNGKIIKKRKVGGVVLQIYNLFLGGRDGGGVVVTSETPVKIEAGTVNTLSKT